MASKMAVQTNSGSAATHGLNRRNVLKVASALLAAGTARFARAADKKGFSIALGGGAARGIAHIPVLEALDELGVTPTVIAGTSMGSIIGACYASGMSGQDIRAFAVDLLSSRMKTLRRLFPGNPLSWTSIFAGDNSAALAPEALMSVALPENVPVTFEELVIPMRIVTADFYAEEQFIIDSGPLHKAIGASSSLPVFLSPVQWDDRVLIDGGFVNPTPFDILDDQPGYIVAVDVTGNGNRETGEIPGALETWIGSSQIALHSLVNERLERIEPDLLIRPEVSDIASMDFHRVEEILAIAEPAREQVKQTLGALLEKGG
ncbi:MAG: patatin-like phospholipase family protein [Pseudomonadota bacterium]